MKLVAGKLCSPSSISCDRHKLGCKKMFIIVSKYLLFWLTPVDNNIWLCLVITHLNLHDVRYLIGNCTEYCSGNSSEGYVL